MAVVHIAGHLGSDAEVRVTPSGQKLTVIRVATNNRRGGKDETTWWRVTMWGDRWDKLTPYLKKGSAVMVVGRMDKPEIYNDKEGRPQISINVTAEIVEFPPFGRPEARQGHQPSGQSQGQEPDNSYNAPQPQPQYATGGQTYGAQNYSTQGQGAYQNQPYPTEADKLPF